MNNGKMDRAQEEDTLALYRYRHRSVAGLAGFLIGMTITFGMSLAGVYGHWLWFIPTAVIGFASLCSALSLLRNSERGCSIDNTLLRWWSTDFPKLDKNIPIRDIKKLYLSTWGDENQIRIMKNDRTVVVLSDAFIGTGHEIFNALIKARPEIDSQVDGDCGW